MTMTLEDFKPDLVDQIIPFRSFKPLQDPREHRLKLVGKATVLHCPWRKYAILYIH